MKFKLFAVILSLSMVAWAQENPAPSTPNSTPKETTMSCCHHAKADAKAMECCGKSGDCCGKAHEKAKCEKDGKSCCSGKDMKACAEHCKKDGERAAAKCCGSKEGKSAMKCCGGKCEPTAKESAS